RRKWDELRVNGSFFSRSVSVATEGLIGVHLDAEISGFEDYIAKSFKGHDCKVCEICGDKISLAVDVDLFVACNEFRFLARTAPNVKPYASSERVERDDDEEDVDDIEHEFNIDDEQNNNKNIVEALLRGRMSYGRGPGDDENAQYPPVIVGRARSISKNSCFKKNSYPTRKTII
nr:cellulose synthase A catalytic subunit 7 [UDP-forming] [Tanacetum cinerariifolium]